jgi:3-isopropylmalate/(R)-2-methylmalate dehydratase small subunit
MMKLPMQLRVRLIAGVISTDDIIPARYKHMFVEPEDMAKHVFENLLPGFAATVLPGDVLCASDTFGVGSSREQAVSSLLAVGVQAVVAPRFGRIFFRNAWNLGLIPIELSDLPVSELDPITLYLAEGRIEGSFGTKAFTPPDRGMLDMIYNGGLLALVQKRMQTRAA